MRADGCTEKYSPAFRTIACALVLMLTVLFAAESSFAAIKSGKTWGVGVTDAKLNALNGTSYYKRLPGVRMYACTGYAEWALNSVFGVDRKMPGYPLVRHIRKRFIRSGNRIVAYGRRVSKKRGGDGKWHTFGTIRPGDIVFFFKRNVTGKKVTKKAIGRTRGELNTRGKHQWTHVAIVGGAGKGIDAKLHHNNSIRNIHFGESIRYYMEYRGQTDYQVFRVISRWKKPALKPWRAVIQSVEPGEDSVTLKWNAAKHAKRYQVQYQAADEDAWITVYKSTKKREAVIEDLLPDTTYRFRVRGLNGEKKGRWSRIVEAVIPAPDPDPDPEGGEDPDPEGGNDPDPGQGGE